MNKRTTPAAAHENKTGTTRVMGIDMDGLCSTLLIPVWARAQETLHRRPLIFDPYSVRIAKTVDYDFSRYDQAWKSQVGVAVRTRIFDTLISRFLHNHSHGTVVILGCGLDTRTQRLDNGSATWVALDIPEAIALRRLFFHEDERHRMISSSIFDRKWFTEIDQTKPVLLMAEGIFMYLPYEKSKEIMCSMATHFPGAEFLLELISPFVAQRQLTDSVKKEQAPFIWGLNSGKEIENWSPHLSFQEEHFIMRQQLLRWRWLSFFSWIPFIKKGNKIVHFRFMA